MNGKSSRPSGNADDAHVRASPVRLNDIPNVLFRQGTFLSIFDWKGSFLLNYMGAIFTDF
jgi:hypothetical protein